MGPANDTPRGDAPKVTTVLFLIGMSTPRRLPHPPLRLAEVAGKELEAVAGAVLLRPRRRLS